VKNNYCSGVLQNHSLQETKNSSQKLKNLTRVSLVSICTSDQEWSETHKLIINEQYPKYNREKVEVKESLTLMHKMEHLLNNNTSSLIMQTKENPSESQGVMVELMCQR
jgi:hypothetical protein